MIPRSRLRLILRSRTIAREWFRWSLHAPGEFRLLGVPPVRQRWSPLVRLVRTRRGLIRLQLIRFRVSQWARRQSQRVKRQGSHLHLAIRGWMRTVTLNGFANGLAIPPDAEIPWRLARARCCRLRRPGPWPQAWRWRRDRAKCVGTRIRRTPDSCRDLPRAGGWPRKLSRHSFLRTSFPKLLRVTNVAAGSGAHTSGIVSFD